MALQNLQDVFNESKSNGGNSSPSKPTPPEKQTPDISKIEQLYKPDSKVASTITFGNPVTTDYKLGTGIFNGIDTFNEDKITDRTFSYSFDPSTLGKDQELGKGDYTLETLYNVNHTAVTDRIQIDTGRKDHTGKTIEINTLRAGMGALGNLDINAYKSSKLDNFRGFDRGNEPYIIKPIGSKDYTTLTSRDGLPFNRAKDDTSRLLKFYGTGAGLSFIAKENITNALIGKFDFFNPLSSVMAPPFANPIQGNTGFLNFTNDAIQDLGNKRGSLRRPLVIEYSKRAQTKIPFGVLGDQTFGVAFVKKAVVPTDQPNIVQKGLRKLKDAVIDKLETAAQVPYVEKGSRFFDISGEGRHTDIGRGYRDEFSRKDPIEEFQQKSFEDDYIKRGDFYVRIKDLRTGGKLLYFRGFVTGITENVSPSFTPTNYIGRSEPVYQYERSERDLSFNLRVYPANETEFTSMYEKIEYLTSLGYPNYLDDGAGLTRMQAPFTELYMAHIGSKAVGQFGFIKSLTYTINETGDWDALQSLPRLFDIAISYQILNKKPSSMATKFYGSTTFYGDKR